MDPRIITQDNILDQFTSEFINFDTMFTKSLKNALVSANQLLQILLSKKDSFWRDPASNRQIDAFGTQELKTLEDLLRFYSRYKKYFYDGTDTVKFILKDKKINLAGDVGALTTSLEKEQARAKIVFEIILQMIVREQSLAELRTIYKEDNTVQSNHKIFILDCFDKAVNKKDFSLIAEFVANQGQMDKIKFLVESLEAKLICIEIDIREKNSKKTNQEEIETIVFEEKKSLLEKYLIQLSQKKHLASFFENEFKSSQTLASSDVVSIKLTPKNWLKYYLISSVLNYHQDYYFKLCEKKCFSHRLLTLDMYADRFPESKKNWYEKSYQRHSYYNSGSESSGLKMKEQVWNNLNQSIQNDEFNADEFIKETVLRFFYEYQILLLTDIFLATKDSVKNADQVIHQMIYTEWLKLLFNNTKIEILKEPVSKKVIIPVLLKNQKDNGENKIGWKDDSEFSLIFGENKIKRLINEENQISEQDKIALREQWIEAMLKQSSKSGMESLVGNLKADLCQVASFVDKLYAGQNVSNSAIEAFMKQEVNFIQANHFKHNMPTASSKTIVTSNDAMFNGTKGQEAEKQQLLFGKMVKIVSDDFMRQYKEYVIGESKDLSDILTADEIASQIKNRLKCYPEIFNNNTDNVVDSYVKKNLDTICGVRRYFENVNKACDYFIILIYLNGHKKLITPTIFSEFLERLIHHVNFASSPSKGNSFLYPVFALGKQLTKEVKTDHFVGMIKGMKRDIDGLTNNCQNVAANNQEKR